MSNHKVLILIPSRYASSRFPGKPLADLDGKSLIQRVFENCSKANNFSGTFTFETYVVTDNDEIEEHVKSFGGNIIRVDDAVETGSERVYLAYERNFKDKNFDLIINVQGDEPLLTGDLISTLAEFHLSSRFDIGTLLKANQHRDHDFEDPNKVKVAFSNQTRQCFYFSRAPIPFSRDKILKEVPWYLHIGIYSYKPQALEDFSKASVTYNENLEKLEQLRALEIGLTIGAIDTDKFLHGVDIPDDLEELAGVFDD